MTMPDQVPQTLDDILSPLRSGFTRGDDGIYRLDENKHAKEVEKAKAAITTLIETVIIGEDDRPNELWVDDENQHEDRRDSTRNQLRAEQRKRLAELL